VNVYRRKQPVEEVYTMGSRVISFRVSKDLYDKFERKCKDEEVSPTVRLREFVEGQCHPTEVDADDKAQVKVINVEGEKLEKVTGLKKKSWFPLDFSPLFRKD
jgi:hypothetical protein